MAAVMMISEGTPNAAAEFRVESSETPNVKRCVFENEG